MKCQILFSGKKKKNILKCRLLQILPRVLSVKKSSGYHIPVHNTTFKYLTLVLLDPIYPAFGNSIDPDSSEANRSGSALFIIKYMNLYQQPGSSNLFEKYM